MTRRTAWLVAGLTLSMFAQPRLAAPAAAPDTARAMEPTALERTRAEAKALMPVAETALGRAFLQATDELPPIEGERTLYVRRRPRAAITPETYEALGDSARKGFEATQAGEDWIYRLYSSPLAYLRALDFAAQAGLKSVDGERVADFGFGNIGQLRVLASLGADAVGVEIDGFLDALYRGSDQGEVKRAAVAGKGRAGTVALAFGQFPATPRMVDAVGKGVALFMSKNTLKLGYVHPERDANPDQLVHLGVDDETFLRRVFECLEPGGLFLVYNLYGPQAPPDQPYRPWATGGFPFPRELAERTGFEVVHWNRDDSEGARRMGRALGWNEGMTDEKFATEFNAMVPLLRTRAR
jgi:hypothetical protein